MPRRYAYQFACPLCRERLTPLSPTTYICARDSLTFAKRDGMWRFLLPERHAYFRAFLQEYQTVRTAEAWGSDRQAYFRALPFQDISGQHPDIWNIRARSYETLLQSVVVPLTRRHNRPLNILDLGAGNGWLSHRLAQQAHAVVALDLLESVEDGLGACVHYDTTFLVVQAEFDRVPFDDGQMDLVIFNGALHYSVDYGTTVAEAVRLLQPAGRLVVMDSPFYSARASGEQMVAERTARFQRVFGFDGLQLPAQSFLTYSELERLGTRFGLRWDVLRPFYGWRWALRRWRARLRGRREPADFVVAVGARVDD